MSFLPMIPDMYELPQLSRSRYIWFGCRAVRRAEHHAETSAKDPRHIGVPRDLGDDILKKVSDLFVLKTRISVQSF
jgi:hypothetical protein